MSDFNVYIPYRALVDAKKLKQWSTGNVCFGDSYFKISCNKKWGKEIFQEACRRTKYIPMPMN